MREVVPHELTNKLKATRIRRYRKIVWAEIIIYAIIYFGAGRKSIATMD